MKTRKGRRVAKQTPPHVQKGKELNPMLKKKAGTVEGAVAVDRTIGKRLRKQREGMKKMRRLRRKGLKEERD
eukprot:6578479-Karenia_brevis.AAC.1